MTMNVLLTRNEVTDARQIMVRRRISALDSPFRSLMRKLRLIKGVAVGDELKGWDVMRALEFIEKHVDKFEPIADIGCYASEVLISLHKLGYTKLTGIDLNSRVREMP